MTNTRTNDIVAAASRRRFEIAIADIIVVLLSSFIACVFPV